MTAISEGASMSGIDPIVRPASARSEWRSRLRESTQALFGLGAILVIVGFVVLVPAVADLNPYRQDLAHTLAPPSGDHLLGTDDVGRDILARMVHGGRTSMLAALYAVAIATIVAVPTGLIAGYRGGLIDSILSRFNDAVMSAPPLVLAVTVVAVLGPALTTAMLAIGFIYSPALFRIVRGAAIQVRSETFIEASRAIGCRESRTVFRHVLPNVLPPVLVQLSLLFGASMLAEASLSFIGLGVQPPTPSWGGLLRTGFNHINSARYIIYPPAVAIGLTVLAFSQLGDGLRTVFSAGRKGGH